MKTRARYRLPSNFLLFLGLSVIAVAGLGLPAVHSSSPTSKENSAENRAGSRFFGAIQMAGYGNWIPSIAPAALAGETIQIFAADCTTPKTAFAAGETICAKTDGVDLTTVPNYYVNWFHPDSSETNGGTITTNPQYTLFSIPTSGSYLGTWKANIGRVTPAEGSIIGNPPLFTVTTGPAISTFAYDTNLQTCTNTPKTSFVLGETVCATATGTQPQFNRRFAWVGPGGVTREFAPNSTDPATDSYDLPTGNTTTINGETFDNRGTWQARVVTSRGSFLVAAPFTVAAATPSVNLSIAKGLTSSELKSGEDATFSVSVYNRGPNDAANVKITDATPANATFVSATPATGSGFSCTGSTTVICTGALMKPGAQVTVNVVYTPGTAGQTITNTATVVSDTQELNNDDNSATAGPYTIGQGDGGGGECTLTCPDSITTSANTTQNGENGAIVTFAATATGDCGTVTSTPASGSFFHVGTTSVTVSTSAGPSCSFTITVTDTAPPTITCPADQTATSCETVSLGTPNTTGTNVTVVGVRSDGRPLTDSYPTGVTTITWTATDSFGRTATCEQTITVTGDQTAPVPDVNPLPTLTSACSVTADVPSATDNCDGRMGASTTDPRTYDAPGTYTIHWTYTDSAGNSSTQEQTVIVTADTVAPTITLCASNLTLAADASCATMPDLTDQIEATDNCSTFTVTQSPAPGTTLGSGNTTVIFTVTDTANNTTTCTAIVNVVDSTPPTITAPPNVPAYTGAGATSCDTVVSDATLGTASAQDNCAGVTVTRSPSGNTFPVGTTDVTWTATDAAGNTATAHQMVTVIDNTPPVLTLNGMSPMTVECHTTFTDPGATASDNCAGDLTASISVVGSVDVNVVGDYTLTYSVSDGNGNSTSIQRVVQVRDTTAPVITVNGYAPSLWPPNHQYVTLQLTDFVTGASDSCDTSLGLNKVVIEKVTSDETENGGGDGNTLNDIMIATDCKSVQLRRERNGAGNGRVYTITFKVTDASSNVGRVTAKVRVPHNNGATAVEDAALYTVYGSCP